MFIKDPTDSTALRVSSEGRAQTDAVTSSSQHHINTTHQKVFNITGSSALTGASRFLYIKNTGTTAVHVTNTKMFSSTAGHLIDMEHVSGSVAGGSDITPTNLTIGVSTSLTAEVKNGTSLSGLTPLGSLSSVNLTAADTDYIDTFPGHIIIPPGQAVSWGLSAAATVTVTYSVEVFEEPDSS